METKLVTAIITTHNRAPNIIQRAINSVVHQTYDNIEIIVVDDSTPSFAQIEEVEQTVKAISDKIIYIKHDSNQGACVARNTGLRHSHGYYVAFLDDDDEWVPEKIEKQLTGFIDDDIAIVYSGIIIVDEIKGRLSRVQYGKKSGMIFDELLKNNIIGSTSSPLIKKKYIEETDGFDALMQSSQDLDLWLRLTMKHPVQYIDCPLTRYHIHSGNRITTDIEKKISGIERINSKYTEYIDNDSETWYLRHVILIPYYLRKYGRRKAFITWIRCVKRQPIKVIGNVKHLIMIVVGIDLYTTISEKIHSLCDYSSGHGN